MAVWDFNLKLTIQSRVVFSLLNGNTSINEIARDLRAPGWLVREILRDLERDSLVFHKIIGTGRHVYYLNAPRPT